MEKLKKFLDTIGVKKEAIQSLTEKNESGEYQDVDLTEIIEGVREHQKEILTNDAEFIKTIRKQADGKARGTVESAIKQTFDLSEDDLKDAGIEGEIGYKELMKIAREKTMKSKDKSVNTLQEELQKANLEIKQLKENDIPALKEQSVKEIKNYKIGLKLKDVIPGEETLIVKRKIAEKIISDYLFSEYSVDLDDKEQLVVKTKDGLVPQNVEKTRNLTIQDIINDELGRNELVRKSNADINQDMNSSKQDLFINKNIDTNMQPKFKPAGLEAAKKNLVELSRMNNETKQ